ncbi:hypothetical protein [Piscinibacterium candidicorallinum]|uniref:DUF2059 domain-containing protein n=1 Tax=Piscinibacterium candidicorallinum TaxID=1793872 RepID=A0ABV7H5R3_9BURK
MIEPLPQYAYDAGLAAGMAAVMNGATDLNDGAARMAQTLGIPPEAAALVMESGYAHFEGVAQRVAASEGLDAADWYELGAYARSNPSQLGPALQAMVYARDTSKWAALTREFLAFKAQRSGVNR